MNCFDWVAMNCIIDTFAFTMYNYKEFQVFGAIQKLSCKASCKTPIFSYYNMEGGMWPWTMCPHTLKKRLKPFVKSFGTKHSYKGSYTVFEGPPEERCGEWAKAKINASWSKVTFVSKWKSLMKGKKSTSTNGWRRWKILVVLLHGAISVLGASARIAQMYSPTWTRAHALRNCANGGGVGFKINSKHLG